MMERLLDKWVGYALLVVSAWGHFRLGLLATGLHVLRLNG